MMRRSPAFLVILLVLVAIGLKAFRGSLSRVTWSAG
jgi:hypothetical protein